MPLAIKDLNNNFCQACVLFYTDFLWKEILKNPYFLVTTSEYNFDTNIRVVTYTQKLQIKLILSKAKTIEANITSKPTCNNLN